MEKYIYYYNTTELQELKSQGVAFVMVEKYRFNGFWTEMKLIDIDRAIRKSKIQESYSYRCPYRFCDCEEEKRYY